ncbi:hypothetical protein [Sneathiella sp.]|uniref:hypothetical protein n=1 Tax=Sneathiella sp. TaxID=1964365 RepID=UPI002FE3A298
MTLACLELSMRASAYGRARGSENRDRLVTAMLDVHFKLPLDADHSALNIADAQRIVRSALRLGRSYGMAGPDFRVIFNEVVEEAPRGRHKVLAELCSALKGKVLS